jgi:hypothetical protein
MGIFFAPSPLYFGALSLTSLEYRSSVRSPVYHLHKKPQWGLLTRGGKLDRRGLF